MGRRIMRGSDDVTPWVVRRGTDGWRINWDAVPAVQMWYHLNLCHEAFTRKRPYPTQEAALRALSESMSLRHYG